MKPLRRDFGESKRAHRLEAEELIRHQDREGKQGLCRERLGAPLSMVGEPNELVPHRACKEKVAD